VATARRFGTLREQRAGFFRDSNTRLNLNLARAELMWRHSGGIGCLGEMRDTKPDIIARIWGGMAPAAKAGDYHRHFITNVAPHLKEIDGNKGALLPRRDVDGQVEVVAITW
jgi:hypothetical protein